MTERQREILRHTLGLDQHHEEYRNYYSASEGHHSWNDLLALEQAGLMQRMPQGQMRDTVFYVTAQGRAALAQRQEG